jgi:hypothetical protein
MFERLKKICDNVINLDEEKIYRDTFRNKGVQQQVIDLNQEQLRTRHVKGDGEPITRWYSNVSQRLYGKPNTPIQLYETGATYDSIKVKVDSEGAKVYGKSIKKTPKGELDLSKVISGNPFGIDEKSIQELRPFFRSIFLSLTRKAIFK